MTRIASTRPRTGALTRALLEAGAIVYALEVDARCWPVLDELAVEFKGQLEVIRGDALETDWDGLLCGGKVPVVGNLPYNVGTEIVARLLTLAKPPKEMVFMLQKEVVQRICAVPDTRDWSSRGSVYDTLKSWM